jgi:S-phase kinase-associated protein 1
MAQQYDDQQQQPLDPQQQQQGPFVKLVSKQTGWSKDVLQSNLSMSTFISTALSTEPTRTVLVVDLSPLALQAIIRYCEYHRGTEPRLIEPPLRSRRMHEVCEYVWDGEFIDDITTQSLELLFDVAVGALYLQIQSLVHLACAKIASMIKSHPLDKVKSILLGQQQQGQAPTSAQPQQLLGQQPIPAQQQTPK